MFRSIRYCIRLFKIARTLGRHNALFPEKLSTYSSTLGFLARLLSSKNTQYRPGQRLVAAFYDLGPSFIKLGQTLSLRPDLIGTNIAEDLSQLQDRLPPFSSEEARQIIELEFNKPVTELFALFDNQPVAAASMAQVHFAEVKDDKGEYKAVAVKVLRPGVEIAFQKDLDLFYGLARFIEKLFPRFKRLRLLEVVDLLAMTIRMELDLRMEASAASELAENMRSDPNFHVPFVDWNRTSQRVLTLERIQGIKIDEVSKIQSAGFDPNIILRQLADAFFYQAFRDGFFHGDLHPGNLFVDLDGKIVAVDFGIMGRMDKKTRYFMADILIGFLNRDYQRLAEIHFEAGYVRPHQDVHLFMQALRAIGEPLQDKSLKDVSIAKLLAQLFSVTEQFDMETQPQLLLFQKSLLMVEGVGRILNPHINMWEIAREPIEKWMREHRGPAARLKEHFSEIAEALCRLPSVVQGLDLYLKKKNQSL